MSKFNIVLTLFLLPLFARASDTLGILQFQEIVLNNHPLIESANLLDEVAEAYLLKGQGALDPKLESDFDRKHFKEQNYFTRWNSEVKIPTRYPVDFSLGYENNSGDFLNDEAFLPNNGLLYGTINISVLRGLLFDEQRFALQESRLLADKNEIEKDIIVRNVVIQALNSYIEWSAAFTELQLVEEYLQRVTDRHKFIIQLFENGDKPAIDTIESRINLNTANKNKINATEKLLLKKQKLNMFIWNDSGEPMMILESVVPQLIEEILSILELEVAFINPSWNEDPLLRKIENQTQMITLQNRLEREWLKPQLDIKLNTIHSLGDNDLSYSYNVNDYKLGASLEVPIRNRKTQGQLRLNEAMINQNILNQSYYSCLLYTSPSPRDQRGSRMPSSA